MLLSQKSRTFSEYIQSKLLSREDLEGGVGLIRSRGATVATLNGSFDLLHAGHLEMIYQASLQADVLIMALNTDESIKKYKSPLRPIIPLEYRIRMVAALEMVNYVTWFDETDPLAVLDIIRPDVHVNGSEYGENCIEAELVKRHGGRIHIVSLVPGLSTTKIIGKIKESCD
jgi:rfaE bifunctional protein nucleotidyltransferase chain/domain